MKKEMVKELSKEVKYRFNIVNKEVGTLLNWNYCIDDCLKMLYQKQTAEEYEYGLE